jgi:hypothetical protein
LLPWGLANRFAWRKLARAGGGLYMSTRPREEPAAQKFPRPSSSGPGRRPFTAKTGVRFPLGAQKKSDWKDVLVRVDMPENRSRVVSIARDADAADVLFIRSEQVEVNNELDPCTANVNEELVAKAIEMFTRDGLE